MKFLMKPVSIFFLLTLFIQVGFSQFVFGNMQIDFNEFEHPKFVRENLNKPHKYHGPNCWGTAMSFVGLSSTPRFMWPEEIKYWQESSLCRKLQQGDALKYGDIINVYGPENTNKVDSLKIDAGTKFWTILYPNRSTLLSEDFVSGYTGYHKILHSAVYIKDQLAFGKDSPNKDDMFYFHQLNQIYGRPQDPECQENQTHQLNLREYQNPPMSIFRSKCDYVSVVYRCDGVRGFINKISKDPILSDLFRIQDKIFDVVVGKENLKSLNIKRIKNLSRSSILQSTFMLRRGDLSNADEMRYVLEYFTASAIQKSLEMFSN